MRGEEKYLFLKRDDHRINLIGGLILVVLTMATGISVYGVMQRQAEAILSNSLEMSRQHSARLFESQIEYGMDKALTLTTRPFIIQNLRLLAADPKNAQGISNLQQVAKSFLQTGFSGMSFYNVRGDEVARVGRFSKDGDMAVALNSKYRVRLLWAGQFALHISMDVLDEHGRRIGAVETEANLPLLTRNFTEVMAIGKTSEFAVCAPFEKDMHSS